jgi:hypothetical protein
VGDDAMTTALLAAATSGVPGDAPHGWSVLRITRWGDRG